MARRVKALRNNNKGISPNHREHRSKKNRKKLSKDRRWLRNQMKRDAFKKQMDDMQKEIKRL